MDGSALDLDRLTSNNARGGRFTPSRRHSDHGPSKRSDNWSRKWKPGSRERRIDDSEGPSHLAASIKKSLNYHRHNTVMRVAMAAVVALLILSFVDEHFNGARYTRATMVIVSNVARSFS
jgi:hypothetical protein